MGVGREVVTNDHMKANEQGADKERINMESLKQGARAWVGGP